MPAFLEPVQGFALRVGKESCNYGDPYQGSGVVNFKNGRWEVIAFTGRSDSDANPIAILRDVKDALRKVGIAEFWWERKREDGSSHWVKVRT